MVLKDFDIAFVGAGCSSWQLAHQLSFMADWHDKKVGLFSDGEAHHRSWCFWSDERHPLQFLVTKSWRNIAFISNGISITKNIAPYQYHYIPGKVFFDYFQNQFLLANPNIVNIKSKISAIEKGQQSFVVHNGTQKWAANQVFNSLPPKLDKAEKHIYLQQHFKGWFIRTEQAVFDEETATLMDFSIEQQNDVRFVYILPFSKYEALIEVTVFSENVYSDSVYDAVFENYMACHYNGVKYTIEQTEQATIPMTNASFARHGKAGDILIGAAAGMVKATTGYAFNRISKDSHQIRLDLAHKKKLRLSNTKGRFKFYDTLLLGIISENPELGKVIFESLFSKVPMPTVLKFLDEQTTLSEEIFIFSKLPFLPFLKQVFKQCLSLKSWVTS